MKEGLTKSNVKQASGGRKCGPPPPPPPMDRVIHIGGYTIDEGYFFYQFKCVGCGKTYKVPNEIELEEVEPNNEHSLTDINP